MNEFVSEAEQLEIEKSEKRKAVIEAFQEFDLSFEIEKYPDLIERLVDTREHFQDAHEMARMIDSIKDRLNLSSVDLENLLTATLLHDIGKSGPEHCDNNSLSREAIKKLFPHGFVGVLPPTLGEFIKLLDKEADPETTTALFSTPEYPVISDMRPIDFLRRHVDWTYQILKNAEVDEELVKIAASHHLLEGKNPANLNVEEMESSIKILELTDKYQAYKYRVLILIDFYQAGQGRGAQKHADIIVSLKRKVSESELLSEEVKAEYLRIIDNVFDVSEEVLEVKGKRVVSSK